MVKRNFGTISGKCGVCGINLYAESDNKPHSIAMPCNLKVCPFETIEEQSKRFAEEMSLPPPGQGEIFYE